jgi:hypothetical protein
MVIELLIINYCKHVPGQPQDRLDRLVKLVSTSEKLTPNKIQNK